MAAPTARAIRAAPASRGGHEASARRVLGESRNKSNHIQAIRGGTAAAGAPPKPTPKPIARSRRRREARPWASFGFMGAPSVKRSPRRHGGTERRKRVYPRMDANGREWKTN